MREVRVLLRSLTARGGGAFSFFHVLFFRFLIEKGEWMCYDEYQMRGSFGEEQEPLRKENGNGSIPFRENERRKRKEEREKWAK